MRVKQAVGVTVLLLVVILAIGVGFYFRRHKSPSEPAPRPVSQRPPLVLLTTLPIMFPEGFTLKAPPSPVLKALDSRYRVTPISVADAGELDHRRLLLMAQPQAQPPEALVDLDDWVRAGGHVLLLADPALEWPSERPLGSLLRPPFAFADTGLLAHWGLRLNAPAKLGRAERDVDGRRIDTVSPGTLSATSNDCAVDGGGFMARCAIGKGRVTVVADADFLAPGESSDSTANDSFLMIELSRLEQ